MSGSQQPSLHAWHGHRRQPPGFREHTVLSHRLEVSSHYREDCLGTLRVGHSIQVFSRSADAWVKGVVVKLEGDLVRVEYEVQHDWCGKIVNLYSKHLAIPMESVEVPHHESGPAVPMNFEIDGPPSSKSVAQNGPAALPFTKSPPAAPPTCNSESSPPAVFQGCRKALPVHPKQYFVDFEYILTLLETERVVLVKMTWLLEQSRSVSGEPLPSHQDLPLEAMVDLKQLRDLCSKFPKGFRYRHTDGRRLRYVMPIVAISHCWLNQDHPDPDGSLLKELVPIMEAYLTEVRCSAEDFCGAVFFAWCSLHQPYHAKENGMYRRQADPQLNEEQKRSHEIALQSMDIWYAHQHTEVWLLTKYFEGQGAKYDDRGWTTWERTVATLLSGQSSVLDLGQLSAADTHEPSYGSIRRICKAARTPPPTAHVFNEIIAKKTFTCGEMDCPRIARNYANNYVAALSCCEDLDLYDIQWSTDEFLLFFEQLKHHASLQKLNLGKNDFGDDEACALGKGLKPSAKEITSNLQNDGVQHCSNLQNLVLPENRIGDAGAFGLAEGLKHCPNLQELWLGSNQISDAGACAFADVLQHCSKLQRVDLSGNCIGDVGTSGLADGLHHCSDLWELLLCSNRIGDAGASALADGLQHCSALWELSLCSNRIGDAGASGLADAIQNCTNLQKLGLGENQIGDTGASALADGLQWCSNLSELLLHGNRIGDSGASGLADGLQHCSKLQRVDLSGNCIGDVGTSGLADGLRHCSRLWELCLCDNRIGEAGKHALRSVLAQSSLLLES